MIVTSYAEAMQIGYEEAEHRLTLQYKMSLVEQQIAPDEAYFASWMQHKPDFGLIVSFTTADGQERIRQDLPDVVWADFVTVQRSDITRQFAPYNRSRGRENRTIFRIRFKLPDWAGATLHRQAG